MIAKALSLSRATLLQSRLQLSSIASSVPAVASQPRLRGFPPKARLQSKNARPRAESSPQLWHSPPWTLPVRPWAAPHGANAREVLRTMMQEDDSLMRAVSMPRVHPTPYPRRYTSWRSPSQRVLRS